jgi:outer membrane protein assembly factor BamA
LLLVSSLSAINIGSLSFSGTDELDKAELSKASGLTLNQPFDPASLAVAQTKLYAHFQAQGRYFIHVRAIELIPLDENSLELAFKLEELLPSTGVEFKLQGMMDISKEKLMQNLLISPETTYVLGRLPQLMTQIASFYQSRGYLFAKVQLDSLVFEKELVAYLGINEGKPLRIKEYIFRGNRITRDNTLLSLTGLQNLKVITPEVLSQAEENILRRSYIRDCVVEPIDDSSLLIKVEEGRMTYLEGVLGMNRIDAHLKLSGQLRLQFQNLWGSDRSIKLFWKRLPSSSSELSLIYHDSGWPGFPVAADLEIKRIEQDSTWIDSKTALEIYYRMLRQNVGLELATQNIRPGTRYPATIEASDLNSIGAFWNYSRIEGGANPYRGYSFNLRYRLNDSEKKLSGASESSAGILIPFSNRIVGFLGVNIRNLENKSAPQWQLYKMGGYNSLRGYREDEFASFRLAWTNIELRYRLNSESRLYLLFDEGFLGRADNTLKYDIFGVGIGMKVKTGLGILGIEYALGYRDKSLSNIGLGMIHAGLDLAF